jgi:hypothetical protein
MADLDIEKNIREYLGDRGSTSRYTSFDYCYNHFQFHREEGRLGDLLYGEALQLSCWREDRCCHQRATTSLGRGRDLSQERHAPGAQ